MAISTKDQILQETFERVALTVDGMGMRIDIGIMGVVLYLNIHGVSTTASCEGHLDHGHPYPWVWAPETHQDALMVLLTAFYHQQRAIGDECLAIECGAVDDECVLRPLGGDAQNSRTQDERAAKLQEYQDEMKRFAIFLKERFFND